MIEEWVISDFGKLIVLVNSLWAVRDKIVEPLLDVIYMENAYNKSYYYNKCKKLRL